MIDGYDLHYFLQIMDCNLPLHDIKPLFCVFENDFQIIDFTGVSYNIYFRLEERQRLEQEQQYGIIHTCTCIYIEIASVFKLKY